MTTNPFCTNIVEYYLDNSEPKNFNDIATDCKKVLKKKPRPMLHRIVVQNHQILGFAEDFKGHDSQEEYKKENYSKDNESSFGVRRKTKAARKENIENLIIERAKVQAYNMS